MYSIFFSMDTELIQSFLPPTHDPYTAIDMLVKVIDLFHRIKGNPEYIESLSEDLYTMSAFLANINIRDLEADVDERTLDALDEEIDDGYED